MSTTLQEAIRQLSIAEKMVLVEDLWDQIVQEMSEEPLLEAQRKELDLRYQEFLQNPMQGSSWTEVKQRILSR